MFLQELPSCLVKRHSSFRRQNGYPFIVVCLKASLNMPDRFEHTTLPKGNALVRANYNDLKGGVHATTKYLEQFFSNLLMGTEYELKNRYMHVDHVAQEEETQSVNSDISKCQNDTLNGTLKITLNELVILKWLLSCPKMTQAELAEKTGKSVRTIKRMMTELKEKGYIRRLNGKRDGKWEVLVDVNQ